MKFKVIVSLLFALTIIIAALFFPTYLFSPGELHKSHLKIEKCTTCHQAFTKPKGQTCIIEGCHDSAYWGKKKGIVASHLAITGCNNCHTEHTGIDGIITIHPVHANITGAANCLDCHRLTASHPTVQVQDCKQCHALQKWKPAKFDHALMKSDEKCAVCHKLPDKHIKSDADCKACHKTKAWKPATFDHALMKSDETCVACHKLPEKHIKSDADCKPCHKIKAWKPATFDHALMKSGEKCGVCHKLPVKHFISEKDCATCHSTIRWKPAAGFKHRFPMTHENRGKQIDCAVCHPKSLEQYSCFGCHEHTARNIRGEHLEEGIRNYDDCMKCHPTGREHEGEGERYEHDDDDDDRKGGFFDRWLGKKNKKRHDDDD